MITADMPAACSYCLRIAALVIAGWVQPAAALDRGGAIEAARKEMKRDCTPQAPCKFTAWSEKDKWYVRVESADRKSPHAILIFNQTGKVVGRIAGK